MRKSDVTRCTSPEEKKTGKVYTQYNGMVQIIIQLLIWMRGIRQGGGGANQQSRQRDR
jgi:predicted heme/steroid binding protein